MKKEKKKGKLTAFALAEGVIERRAGAQVAGRRSIVLPRPVELVGRRVLDPSAEIVVLKVATRRRLVHSARCTTTTTSVAKSKRERERKKTSEISQNQNQRTR